MIRLGIIAPSSVIPKVEFELGVDHLEKNGFEVEVHPQVSKRHFFYAGSDEDRAKAFLEFAFRKDLQALWCARGGYGATHLLPFLEKATKTKKPPKKTLLGYSDATALMEFARTRWGWNTIHAPMPSLRTFGILSSTEWTVLMDAIQQSVLKTKPHPMRFELSAIHLPKGFKKLEAPVVGGNLAVWNALLGTKYVGNARGKILFFEEISENLGRVNRMVHHLEQCGGLKGVKAVVLGDFTDCNDSVPKALIANPPRDERFEEHLRHPPADAMGYIREIFPPIEALEFVFKGLGERNKIPVFRGMPIGHGSNHCSIFLGKKHELRANGQFVQV